MSDLISRQAAIEVIDAVFPVDPMKSEYAQGIACGAALAKTYVGQLPSAQPKRTEERTETHACDLISRLSEIRSQYNCFNESEEPYYHALSEVIKKLSEQADGDTISRQAAIDALDVGAELLRRVLDEVDVVGAERAKYEWGLGLIESCISDIKELPSAQPEIIRCKDCRWWDKYGDYDNGYCMAAKHGYWSEHWDISIRRTYKGDFYCADAEPKGEQE